MLSLMLNADTLQEHDDPSSMENKQQRIANMPIPGDDVMSEYRPALSYDPSRMFEPLMYRELAAETVREYMQGREYSPDPDVSTRTHEHTKMYIHEEMLINRHSNRQYEPL